jgi:hypothetical protein
VVVVQLVYDDVAGDAAVVVLGVADVDVDVDVGVVVRAFDDRRGPAARAAKGVYVCIR